MLFASSFIISLSGFSLILSVVSNISRLPSWIYCPIACRSVGKLTMRDKCLDYFSLHFHQLTVATIYIMYPSSVRNSRVVQPIYFVHIKDFSLPHVDKHCLLLIDRSVMFHVQFEHPS